jgi:hypothetical protein
MNVCMYVCMYECMLSVSSVVECVLCMEGNIMSLTLCCTAQTAD